MTTGAISHPDVVKTAPLQGRGKELLIAAASVAVVSLAVTDSEFLVTAVGIGLAIAAVLRFEFFVYALVFLVPWYPLIDYKPPFRDVFLLSRIVLLIGVALIRRRQKKSFYDWIAGSSLKKGVLLFAGVATVSLLVAEQRPNTDAYRILARLFSYMAMFFGLVGWLETRQQVMSVVKTMLISTIGVALFGYYQVIERSYTDLYFHLYPLQEDALEPWNGRITSLLFHFNFLAGYLNLVLPMALACMTVARSRGLRIVGLICHSTAGAALYFTGSRGGLIAYGGMLLIAVFYLVPRRAALIRLVLSLLLAAGIVLSIQEPGAANRLTEVDEFTQASRLALWGAAGIMFLSHPVLGVGYGNYRALYHDYIPGTRPNELDAHNLYLQFLSETGLIGFLVFCFLVGAFTRIAFKLAGQTDPYYRIMGIGLGGALAATLIHGLADYIFNVSPQSGVLLWLVLALGWAGYEDLRSAGSAPQRELARHTGGES
jgi:O-antigen ligase